MTTGASGALKERDPVCLMSIDPARAAGKAEYGGHTYYFCSRYCRARFEADPALYAR